MEYTDNKLNNYKQTLKWAWILEIILCLGGLYIAFALTMAGLNDSTGAEGMPIQAAMGFIPLVVVALLELTKIPLVSSILYSESSFRKLVMMILLPCVCFLTFISLMTGLEQSTATREYNIEQSRVASISVQERIDIIDERVSDLSNLTAEQIKQGASDGLEIQLAVINAQILDYEKRSDSLSSPEDTAQIMELKRQIESLEGRKKQSILSYIQEQKALRSDIRDLDKNEQRELENSWSKSSIKQRYTERRTKVQIRIDESVKIHQENLSRIDTELASINQQIINLGQLDKGSLMALNEISIKTNKLLEEKSRLINESNKRVDAELENSLEKAQLKSGLIAQREQLRSKKEELRDSINRESNKSPLHRLSAAAAGKESAADLTKKEASFYKLIFIVSIPLIGCLIGPFMAYSAISNHLEIIKPVNPKKRKLSNTIRRAFISLRKKLMKPKVVTQIEEVEVIKEVIKEVEVEKLVHQIIEIPTPVEVTRFVGIPVPKSPEELPEFSQETGNAFPAITELGVAK